MGLAEPRERSSRGCREAGKPGEHAGSLHSLGHASRAADGRRYDRRHRGRVDAGRLRAAGGPGRRRRRERRARALPGSSGVRLLGRRIVVTRAAEQADEFVDRLERLGAEAMAAPTIELDRRSPHRWRSTGRSLRSSRSTGSFSPARTASTCSSQRLYAVRRRHPPPRARAPGGDRTGDGASALAARGLRADLVPETFRGEALARCSRAARRRPARATAPCRRRAGGAADVLARAGADVVDVPPIGSKPAGGASRRVRDLSHAGAIDAITFTSPSTVRDFHALLDGGAGATDGSATIACIGPVTAESRPCTRLECGRGGARIHDRGARESLD